VSDQDSELRSSSSRKEMPSAAGCAARNPETWERRPPRLWWWILVLGKRKGDYWA
jgi:hypothetical protein